MNPHGKFILCVDDDSDDLFLLEEAIRSVEPASSIMQFQNGIEALSYLQEAKTQHDLPCVVVLDVNMPVMDGRETLRRIKADAGLANVQIVILTTSSSPTDMNYFNRMGVTMFTKPVNHGDLRKIAEIFMEHCR